MKAFDKIISALKFPHEILSLEYFFGSEGVSVHVVHLKSVKGQVQLIKSAQGDNLHKILKDFSPSIPVFLILSGRKVLTKNYNIETSAISDSEIISRTLPNVAYKDLFFQIDQVSNNKKSVAAIRKEIVLEIINDNAFDNRDIVDIQIGLYGLWDLLSINQTNEIGLGHHLIHLSEYRISSKNGTDNSETELFGEKIKASLGCVFLNGLSALSNSKFSPKISEVIIQQKNWQYGTRFRTGIKVLIPAFLLVLFISFSLFSYYSGKNNELAYLNAGFTKQMQQVKLLQKEYEEKKRFLTLNGEGKSDFSKKADQLGSLVPKGITLEKMEFYPLEKHLKKENLVRFQRNKVHITGEADNYENFQNWIKEINELDWTGEIKISGYQEKNSRHEAEFSLYIIEK